MSKPNYDEYKCVHCKQTAVVSEDIEHLPDCKKEAPDDPKMLTPAEIEEASTIPHELLRNLCHTALIALASAAELREAIELRRLLIGDGYCLLCGMPPPEHGFVDPNALEPDCPLSRPALEGGAEIVERAKEADRLREAGEWVLNVVNGIGREGGPIDPHDDEPEAAFDALKAALRGEGQQGQGGGDAE